MKPDSIRDPDVYLGAKLRKVTLPNRVVAWAMSPSKYIQESVKSVEEYLMREYGGRKLQKKADTLFPRDYRPEIDTSQN